MIGSLSEALKQLRLSGLAETLEVRLQEAQGNHLTHSEFLELVLQDELLVRKDRQLERRLKLASFRELKSLEDFDWSFNRSVKKSEVYQLATGKRSGEYLFEIVMRRYETRSTMMTTNRPLEDWGKLLGDVPTASAILDRFLHHAEIMTITGKSYRLKDRAAGSNQANALTGSNKSGEDSKPAKAPTGSPAEEDQ